MSDLRSLPSVSDVLAALGNQDAPSSVVTGEIRRVIERHRKARAAGESTDLSRIPAEVEGSLQALARPSLRRVINATGVILHTNLGRSPLAGFQPIAGYSNLEFDLATGKRGRRDIHTANLLDRLLHRPAILVNNNAAAIYLTLRELAAGEEVIVSRGELIEIGDGFRIPEIMSSSGAVLREVGTTNKTHIDDYRRAISQNTRLLMRVHPSNFHISGFAFRPKLEELAGLAKETGIPLYEDLGSGCLVDLKSAGVNEPLVADSFKAGVNIVSFSCDKLLGGPQTGIIAGDASLVERVRRNFMYRALRVDKLVIECLENTLRNLLFERWAEIPALAAIFTPLEELRDRAMLLCDALKGISTTVQETTSPIGGGSTPDQSLPTWIVAIETNRPDAYVQRLRQSAVLVIARIADDRVILDMRSVAPSEVNQLTAAVLAVAESIPA